MPLSTLIILVAIALATIWLTISAAVLANHAITRLEKKMSNNSAAGLAAFNRVTAALAAAVADNATKDQTIAQLQQQIAAAQPDPTGAQDLVDDENALDQIIAKANEVAPEPAPQPDPNAAAAVTTEGAPQPAQ